MKACSICPSPSQTNFSVDHMQKICSSLMIKSISSTHQCRDRIRCQRPIFLLLSLALSLSFLRWLYNTYEIMQCSNVVILMSSSSFSASLFSLLSLSFSYEIITNLRRSHRQRMLDPFLLWRTPLPLWVCSVLFCRRVGHGPTHAFCVLSSFERAWSSADTIDDHALTACWGLSFFPLICCIFAQFRHTLRLVRTLKYIYSLYRRQFHDSIHASDFTT